MLPSTSVGPSQIPSGGLSNDPVVGANIAPNLVGNDPINTGETPNRISDGQQISDESRSNTSESNTFSFSWILEHIRSMFTW